VIRCWSVLCALATVGEGVKRAVRFCNHYMREAWEVCDGRHKCA
jgi:hypothetical protein